MIIFLDANALIYLIEGAEPFAGVVRRQLKSLTRPRKRPVQVAMSTLSRLECRTGPLKSRDTETLADYDAFFARPDLLLVPMSTTVIDLATALRAHQGLKTPDALQAACCLQLGADHRFLTGDKAFRHVAGLHVRLLGPG